MRINIEPPFDEEFKAGYVKLGKNGRRRVDMIRFDGTVASTSYARYLMSVKLGSRIPKEFDVDHIDGDKTNDSVDNLQVLTKEAHLAKTLAERKPAAMVDRICPKCKVTFQFPLRNLSTHPNPCCSRVCGYSQGNRTAAKRGTRSDKSPLVDRICPACERIFQLQERLLKRNSNPSCSRSCRSVLIQRNRRKS